MSERFSDGSEQEKRSSVQINCTAKGEPQVSVKVYAGDDEANVRAAKALALALYTETMTAVGR